MRNIKAVLEYDGTRYRGFQRQRSVMTVQQVLETALERFYGQRVLLVSCGRTDSGVHARGHVVNFLAPRPRPLWKVRDGLNSFLPPDVVVKRVSSVPAAFHAQKDAKKKTYRYTILMRPMRSPFQERYAFRVPYRLDVALMRREARALVGRHDFKGFQSTGSPRRSTVRTVFGVKIAARSSVLSIDVTADGFLYNMARNIVGMLIEVGRGKVPAGTIRKILAAKDFRLVSFTAPARGLCLERVKY